MNNELLTVGDAARELSLSPDTIRLYEKQGKLRAMRTRGGQRLFQLSDVKRLKADRHAANPRGLQ